MGRVSRGDAMTAWFEELDFRRTPLGELVLQRRRVAALDDAVVYEVKLGEAYLMSSLFHEAEVALAERGLGALDGAAWDIVIGGLGLGYTAAAALRFPQVHRMLVIEALQPVIDWHRQGLTPNGATLANDPRCVLHGADFFACARASGFDPEAADRRFDAVLLDIDHTPTHWLSPAHADFYTEAGLHRLRRFLKPGGVFGLWSNEAPDDGFLRLLARVFDRAEGHVIQFDNPLQGTTATNGLYIAR